MKRKLFKAFLMLVALIIFMLPGSIALGADEDFTTYTEVDTASKVTVTSGSVSITDLDGDEETRIYKDFGAGFFSGDWDVYFHWKYYEIGAASSDGMIVMSNDASSAVDFNELVLSTGSPDAIGIRIYGQSTLQLQPMEHKQGSAETYGTACTFTYATYIGSDLYIHAWFDDDAGTYGTFYFKVFTDEEMTVQLGSTASIALTEENSWRYFLVFDGNDRTTGGLSNDYFFSDLYFTGLDPEIENTSETYQYYDGESHYFEILGTVLEDGGEDQTATIYWSTDNVTFFSTTQYGTYNTDDTPSQSYACEDGETYYYYWELSSVLGDFQSEIEEFEANVPASIPQMEISYFYDRWYQSGNSTVQLNGGVTYDGGSNTTGYMQYSENATDWTDSVSYVEDLQTDDNFSVNLTGLSDGTYYFRSKGVNDTGTGYSSIFQFVVVDWDDPVVTGTYSDVDQDSVYITGTLDDDGGEDEIYVNYRYRVWTSGGTNTWVSTSGAGNWIEESDNVTWLLDGLLSNTHYEFQIYGFGYCYTQGFCESIAYSSTYSFWTSGYQGSPTIHLDEVGYYDDYTAYTVATVTNDGNLSCTAGIEYSYNEVVWYDCEDSQIDEGLETDDEYVAYISPSKASENVVYRAWICNYNGCTYSNKIWYMIEQGSSPSDDTDTEPDSNSTNPFDWLARVVLGVIGMNNEGGKLLFVILCMMLLFGIFFKSKFFRIFMPILCFTAFLVIGWIPVVIMVVVLLGGGLGAWYLFKKVV